MMIHKAIASAKRHGINLSPGLIISLEAFYKLFYFCLGIRNSANGNCSIESVLLNIVNRPCFNDSFPFSADYYRRIWVTDFMNKTVDDPTWNIYTKKEWEEGWNEMKESGVYERGLFGDLFLLAIACGVKKFLLIFNTNLQTPHEPIYVCDPRKFGVEPDTLTPVVLAYDMAHYESLHTLTTSDEKKTYELVDMYLKGHYKFTKLDLPFLLTLEVDKEELNEIDDKNIPKDKTRPVGAQNFQESLPSHLKRKRPKEMTLEEKKEYNNLRRKCSRKNEKKTNQHTENKRMQRVRQQRGQQRQKLKKRREMKSLLRIKKQRGLQKQQRKKRREMKSLPRIKQQKGLQKQKMKKRREMNSIIRIR